MISLIATTFLMSVVSLLSLRQFAFRYGFVDRPTSRKRHQGEIPFIGGVAIFATLLVMSIFLPYWIPAQNTFLFCCFILVAMGTWDDKYDLSPYLRLFLLTAISCWLSLEKGISMNYLGDLLGGGDILIAHGDTILTTLAIIGCLTAYNMIDGMDGLFGSLACITFTFVGYLFYQSGQIHYFHVCLFFITALIPYLCCNLGLLPNRACKVFIGDAGTYLIGFAIIWLLIEGSQLNVTPSSQRVTINASTALWIIAVPLMDMAMVMLRRIRKGQSPFKADRLHIHYVFQRLGLSSRATLLFICLISILFSSIGVLAQIMHVPNYVMFYLFLITFVGYVQVMKKIWRITVWLRKQRASHILSHQ